MSYDLKLENGDIKVGSNGDLALVQDSEKLRQDILKILITPLGGNKSHPWYGSSLTQTMIGNLFDPMYSLDVSTEQVRGAVQTYQMIQKTQSQTQTLTAAETMVAIKDVYVNTNSVDQRILEVKVSILSSTLTAIDVKFIVKLY